MTDRKQPLYVREPTPADAPLPNRYSSFECHACDQTIADTDLRFSHHGIGGVRFCSAVCARAYAVEMSEFADMIEKYVSRAPWSDYEVPADWRIA